MDVRLPRLAEGADSGTVVNILVKEGESVQKGQTLLELENQKAVAPIPAPSAGIVSKIHVTQGEGVAVGQLLVSLSQEPAAVLRQAQDERSLAPIVPGLPPPASPTVRRMALELGLDLRRIRGSDPGGRITAADLRAHIEAAQTSRQPRGAAPKIDFSKWGAVTRKPFSPLRKAIARAMMDSWTTIPHVTQFDEADPSVVLGLIEKHGPAYEKKGARLTLTGLLLRALVPVLQKYPVFNSSLDESSGELVLKQYLHIGIAVDTEAGLIVPILRDVEKKSLLQISQDLAALVEKTRQRKLASEDLQGGTFTLSNQGGIGGGHFTPIIHKPEVAILGLGRAKPGRLPLSLSYDHRVIDGADAARFITALVERIQGFPPEEVRL